MKNATQRKRLNWSQFSYLITTPGQKTISRPCFIWLTENRSRNTATQSQISNMFGFLPLFFAIRR